MNENQYSVQFVHDHFIVTTITYAPTEDEAKRTAEQHLTQSEALPEWIGTAANEINAEKEGELT